MLSRLQKRTTSRKLERKDISYKTIENAFVEISDPGYAQKLSERINPEGPHNALDIFAERYCPIAKELSLGYS